MHDLLAARKPAERYRPSFHELEPLSTLVPDIDRDLEAIVARASDPNPNARYHDASQLSEDLQAWLDGAPVRARRLVGIERVRRWVDRNPRRLLQWLLKGASYFIIASLLIVGISKLVEIGRAVGDANRMWNKGDLLSTHQALLRVPDFLDVFLSSHLRTLAGPLRNIEGNGAEVLVTRELAQSRVGEAITLAASYLERDGFERYPSLIPFLVRSCEESSTRETGLRTVMQFLNDRPLNTPEEIMACTSLRTKLLDLWNGSSERKEVFHVVSALSGCGTTADLISIAERLKRSIVDDPTDSSEFARVGYMTLEEIIRRAHSCEWLPEACSVSERVIAVCRDIFEIVEERTKPKRSLQQALDEVFRAFLFARRATGDDLDLGSGIRPNFLSSWWIRSAALDPLLKQDIENAAFLVEDPRDDAYFFHLGLAIGSYGDPDLSMSQEQEVHRLVDPNATNLERALKAYRSGIQAAEEEARGIRRVLEVDPRARLGDRLSRTEEPMHEIPFEQQPLEDKNRVLFSLRKGRILIEGGDGRLRGRAFGIDQSGNPNDGCIVLSKPSVSEIIVDCEIERRPDAQVELEIDCQRANRSFLPYFGDARLEISVDNKPCASFLVAGVTGTIKYTLPYVIEGDLLRNTITIRLAEDSNASAWLTRIEVSSPTK